LGSLTEERKFIEGINYGNGTDSTAGVSNPYIEGTKDTPWTTSKHKREPKN